MMRRKLVLAGALLALTLAQPTPALARPCEDICGENAAANCDNIDSFRCGAYIMGCLAGCSVGKLFRLLVDE